MLKGIDFSKFDDSDDTDDSESEDDRYSHTQLFQIFFVRFHDSAYTVSDDDDEDEEALLMKELEKIKKEVYALTRHKIVFFCFAPVSWCTNWS